MRIFPSLRNDDGFTIIEIMIASLILGVVAYFVATLLMNTSKQQTRVEERAGRADFIQSTTLDLRMNPVPTP